MWDKRKLQELNITEKSIQHWRDFLLKALTETTTQRVALFLAKNYLPLVIDMLDDYSYSVTPGANGYIKIEINLI